MNAGAAFGVVIAIRSTPSPARMWDRGFSNIDFLNMQPLFDAMVLMCRVTARPAKAKAQAEQIVRQIQLLSPGMSGWTRAVKGAPDFRGATTHCASQAYAERARPKG